MYVVHNTSTCQNDVQSEISTYQTRNSTTRMVAMMTNTITTEMVTAMVTTVLSGEPPGTVTLIVAAMLPNSSSGTTPVSSFTVTTDITYVSPAMRPEGYMQLINYGYVYWCIIIFVQ